MPPFADYSKREGHATGSGRRSGSGSPGGFEASFEISGDAAVAAMFAQLPVRVQQRIMAPLLREAAKTISTAAEARAPEQLGLLKQAIGVSLLHKYGSTLFITAGVRQGFGRTMAPSARRARKLVKRSRGGRGFTPMATRIDPARYGGTVQAGRGPISASSAKVLYSRPLDLVLGRVVKAAAPRPFMRQTFSDSSAAVISRIQSSAPALIEAEAAALANK
jgi:hypothetical protein